MSNSSLVTYTNISPNRYINRNHVIDTITIHCIVGQLSVETIGNMFKQPSYKASCNYCVGTDGRIGLIVGEEDGSWCSSNEANDRRAITIECACDKTDPYAVNDKVMASLINLIADICKRNGIKELKWKADKSLIGQVDKQNMTVHRWFKNKACPGEYLYSRHGEIASKVNNILNGTPIQTGYYRVGTSWSNGLCVGQIGAYTSLDNAKKVCTVGYNVYDENGSVVYSNQSTPIPTPPQPIPAPPIPKPTVLNNSNVLSWQKAMNIGFNKVGTSEALEEDGGFGDKSQAFANKYQMHYLIGGCMTAVKWLQRRLNVLGYYNGSIDGKIENGTLRAIKSFQNARGLKADGYVGTSTTYELLK